MEGYLQNKATYFQISILANRAGFESDPSDEGSLSRFNISGTKLLKETNLIKVNQRCYLRLAVTRQKMVTIRNNKLKDGAGCISELIVGSSQR